MTMVDALLTGKPCARPTVKHKGSHGDGWLDPEYIFNLLTIGQIREMRPILIDKADILANDWTVKSEES